MCLVTTPKRDRSLYRREYYDDAPRPVSNYHGGPQYPHHHHHHHHPRNSATYTRRTSSSVPRERASYRSSYRNSAPRVYDIDRDVDAAIEAQRSRNVSNPAKDRQRNIGRSHSIRSKRSDTGSQSAPKHRFAMSSLRGMQQPELSKKLYKLIKQQNHVIGAYESAGRESQAVASQLSDWGESTEDDALSDLSDKLGVLLAEVAEQEDVFAQNLEDSRGVLKQIRNTEQSVQPSRNHKQKIQDEIQKLKYKEPESTKLVTLEQELVRAEAQSLVAEAQLTNVTRQKFKEAYDVHTAAIIERAEKQILLAQQARRLVSMLDDSPIVPGEERPAFANAEEAREVLNDAEDGLRTWQRSTEPIQSTAGKVGSNAMPSNAESVEANEQAMQVAQERVNAGSVDGTTESVQSSDRAEPPYPTEQATA
ncbi:hypothetical protein KC316_g4263 [Hortaea werneckii]|nr:hypothetical protein KC334_g8035 [Hortaea werneckii]KAI7006077.1 hypothetical protein KC355_g7917 [Hortaea werneckii]KAI7588848.1 hypothetical protein KC316_g4263 [Hortaea werneckii]